MRTKNLEEWDISICGLNCAKCDIYQAAHGNDKLRDEIVNWFREKHNKIVKPEQIICEGCRGPLDDHWSPKCKLMLCARNKGLQYCFQCEDFPCVNVNKFSSDDIFHHRRTIENLKRMKKIGIKGWIAEQKRKGQCVFCP